jgi:hypothetical protein
MYVLIFVFSWDESGFAMVRSSVQVILMLILIKISETSAMQEAMTQLGLQPQAEEYIITNLVLGPATLLIPHFRCRVHRVRFVNN